MAVTLRSSAVASGVSSLGGGSSLNTGTTEPGRVLLAGLITADFDGTLATLSSIDCNGEALVLWSNYDLSTHNLHRIYYLPTPFSTGPNPINVAFTDLMSWSLQAIMWVGADLVTPLSAAVQANDSDAAPTTSVDLTRQSALFTLIRSNYASSRPTVLPANGQVKLTEQNVAFDVSNNFLGNCGRVAGGGGGVPFSDAWTQSAAGVWRMQSVVVNERQQGAAGQYLAGRP